MLTKMKIELSNQKKKQLERIHETIVTRYNNDYLESEKLTPENDVSQSKFNSRNDRAY